MQKVFELIDAGFSECVESARELLAIPSYFREDGSGFPFGLEVENAMQFMLRLSKSMGFKTGYVDGYACWAELGEGEELVGVLAHLDVVPEGAGWSTPAFEPSIHNDRLYARGASDDKGPAIACLYALKALKESGLPVKRRARLILGGDEEIGFRDVKYYISHAEIPTMGFSPDSEFPVVFSEKGIAHVAISADFPEGSGLCIESIESGERPNVVPHSAIARFSAREESRGTLIEHIERSGLYGAIELIGDNANKSEIAVLVSGISAHAAMPDEGDNAAVKLLKFLGGVEYARAQKAVLDSALALFGPGFSGAGLGIACGDDISGALTMNLGRVNVRPGMAEFIIDIRYPSTLKFEPIMRSLESRCMNNGYSARILQHKMPLYVPKDTKLVSTLSRVFGGQTGLASEPVSVGGGTYCRAFENFVAFGPRFPGEPSLAHGPDEYISLEQLKAITKIYAHAIYELIK